MNTLIYILVSLFLQDTKCVVADVEAVCWRPAPYVKLVPEARLADTGPGPLPAPGYNLPSETHDVTGFYPEIGPDKDLEAIISERINNEARVQASAHVIKERDQERETNNFKKNSSKPPTDSKHLLRPPVTKGRGKVQNFQNQCQISKGVVKEKEKKFKVEGKWPKVEACYTRYNGPHQRNGHTDTGAGQLINHLNNLRKVEDHCRNDVEVVTYPVHICHFRLLYRDHLTSNVFCESLRCCLQTPWEKGDMWSWTSLM